MDPRVLDLLARQQGVVGRRQVLAMGVSRGRVDGWLHRGRLDRVADGVYALVGAPPTPLREPMVAALRCGPGAAVVGVPMLAAAGVDGLRGRGSIVVLTRPGRRVRNVPWRTRSDAFPGLGVATSIAGVPSYGLGRHLLELAVDLEAARLADVVDACRWHRPRVLRSARALCRDVEGHPGARRLLRMGLLASGAPESRPERELAQLLAHHAPVPQVEVLPGVRVDLLVPRAGLVVEYDGAATHTARAQVDRDRARRERIREAGYVVLSVRSTDLADAAGLVRRVDDLVGVLVGEAGSHRGR